MTLPALPASGSTSWYAWATAVHNDLSDSDLQAIIVLGTQAYGRGLLTLTDQAALMALIQVATAAQQGVVELATNTEAQAGTDTTRAVTPAGLKAAIDDAKTAILGAGVPAALDTLDELAAALGDDANFAGTVTTALSNKQPLDSDLTAIAALTSAANKLPYATGAGAWSLADLTVAGRSLIGSADASAQLTALGVSTFIKTLLDDADGAAARTTIGAAAAAVINTEASNATPAPSGAALRNEHYITALAAAAAIGAPSGSPVDGATLFLRIDDNGTARALTWNAIYTTMGVTLPSTTTAGKTLAVQARYNAGKSKWQVYAVAWES